MATSHSLSADFAGLHRDLPRQPLQIQDALLPRVSRTFALTIPQLPQALRIPVTNAYLLCRIADTIEDAPALSPGDKRAFLERFLSVLAAETSAERFAAQLAPLLGETPGLGEPDLVRDTPAVMRITLGLRPQQRAAVLRCLTVMTRGMMGFQAGRGLRGLSDLQELEQYCYVVAGVVGEMLTELFCDYSETIASRHAQMMPLAVSFGMGLQMTNILKDIWEDRRNGSCWLPRDVFSQAGIELGDPASIHLEPAFRDGLETLIGITHGRLRQAIRYTRLIPRQETGLRRFCLLAIGLAVFTLRKIHRNPGFSSAKEVKVCRRTVHATLVGSRLAAHSNTLLEATFRLATVGLPQPTEADAKPTARRNTAA